MLTLTDLFCGAGGSSTGAIAVPGIEVRIHSVAKGRKRVGAQPDLFGELLPDAASERSRATMWDVPRFAEAHRYQAVIVENVVDAWHWEPFRAWLMAMACLGYDHQLVFLNSMHAQTFGVGAPQSRDRMYVVFWRKGNQKPDFGRVTGPAAVCPEHGAIRARQAFKRNDRAPWGRYRSQYVYICGTTGCQRIVEPVFRPAAEIIDWDLLGQRIGDRSKPLADKTLARIRAGIEKYWGPFIAEHRHEYRVRDIGAAMQTVAAASNHFGLAVPVEGRDGKAAQTTAEALRTQTTRNETGIGMLVPSGGTWRQHASPLSEPAPTRTTRENDGIAVPAFIAELRGGGSKHRPVADPLATVTASGNHHGLVTAYYGNGSTRPADEALTTVTAVERHALIMRNKHRTRRPGPDDHTGRRTDPHRHHEGPPVTAERGAADHLAHAGCRESRTPSGSPSRRRSRGVRQAGNAVTPPAARDLVGVVAESLGVVA